eukprot:5916607-Ditylum_brightwellii.AAC.2
MLVEQKAFEQAKKIVCQETLLTDHKNLAYKHFNTARVILQCIILEDYAPKLICIPGNTTVVANMLSHQDDKNGSKQSSADKELFLLAKALTANNIKDLRNKELNSLSEKPDDITIVECYVDDEDKAAPPHIYPLKT